MEDLKNTLKESLEFYLGQEKAIISRLAILPKGNIKKKNIKGEAYYYLQYRKGRRVVDEYIGKKIPDTIIEQLQRRKQLETDLIKTRESIRLLHQKPAKEADLIAPIKEILYTLTKEGLWDSGITIIGSWCFLLYQKYLPIEKYPLKTQDIDILIPQPYKGKQFDLSSYLRSIGFEEHFNLDGSIAYVGNELKVEFLAPQRGRGTKRTQYIKQISVAPQLLRFLEILFEDPIVIRISPGLKVKVPSPACFMLHKLLIATRPQRTEKMEKDLRQAIYAGRFALTDKEERAKLNRQWKKFPETWKRGVRRALNISSEMLPLERALINKAEAILK